MAELTVSEIRERLRQADEHTLPALERSLRGDSRKVVQSALKAACRRVAEQQAERERICGLWNFDQEILTQRGGTLLVGLDEVGRGPLAGPLAVGAVAFDLSAGAQVLPQLVGLNDSKQVKPAERVRLAQTIHEQAAAWTVAWIEPQDIDRLGITASLRKAFTQALHGIEQTLGNVDVILLDGNPLGLDSREVNVVKGDSKSASIAAASIVAKVARDHYMDEMDQQYPGYGFGHNKGYGSADHEEAIRSLGLSPLHRRSFCTKFLQESLF